ncbi:MAG TPA: LytTR family DNA-binding domain-containing protein, partial [Allosphingosinicella sp.]
GNYAILHAGGAEHMIRASLQEVLGMLGPAFARTSRSGLINIAAVAEVKDATRNGDATVVLRSGAELRLTRTFRRALMERLRTGCSGSRQNRSASSH